MGSAGDGGGVSSGATPATFCLNSGHGASVARSARESISARSRVSTSKATHGSKLTSSSRVEAVCSVVLESSV
eukprot:7321530-Alexandrium_andersonii.AAC.1